MKLNSKFVILIISFTCVTMMISVAIFYSFDRIRQMQNFENEALKLDQLITELGAYPAIKSSSSTDLTTLVSGWAEICEKASAQVDIVLQPSFKALLTEEELADMKSLENLWLVMQPKLTKVTEAFDDFAELPFSAFERSSLLANGASTIIYNLPESDERRSSLLFTLLRLNQVSAFLVETRANFGEILANLNASVTARIESLFRFFLAINVALLLGTSAIIFAIALKVTGRITKRVRTLQDISGQLALKDFSMDFGAFNFGKDEISGLAATLSRTIADLNVFLEMVKNSSNENADLGESISIAADDTASATHEIRAAIESLKGQFSDMDNAVKHSAASLNKMSLSIKSLLKDNSAQTNAIQESDTASGKMAKTVEKIRQMAVENCSGAEDMQEAVAYGDRKIEESNAMMREVSSQLESISEIVTVINAIAEQTNILSMNAAIESAHAGESGKGFSVVAEEIRVLAESTGENSRHITDSLFMITSKMQEATSLSDNAAKAFADVNTRSVRIHDSLSEILDNINEAAGEAEKVATFSQRITAAAEKMNTSYEDLNVQRKTVSSQISTLEDVFAMSRSGIDEINIGAADIVNRMLEVSHMSAESREKMHSLSDNLNQFKTFVKKEDIEAYALANASQAAVQEAMGMRAESVANDLPDAPDARAAKAESESNKLPDLPQTRNTKPESASNDLPDLPQARAAKPENASNKLPDLPQVRTAKTESTSNELPDAPSFLAKAERATSAAVAAPEPAFAAKPKEKVPAEESLEEYLAKRDKGERPSSPLDNLGDDLLDEETVVVTKL